MAQVYFITRGHADAVEKWISYLRTKGFEWHYNGDKGIIEGMLRPIQLWEYCYPKEYRDIVLNTIFDGQKDLGKHQSSTLGNLGLTAIRKALAAKKIAPFNLNAAKLYMPSRAGFSTMGIGERDDKMNTHPATGIQNEGL